MRLTELEEEVVERKKSQGIRKGRYWVMEPTLTLCKNTSQEQKVKDKHR